DQVIAEANARLSAAAVRSRYPSARLAAARPSPEAAASLLHRLLAEGVELERMAGPENDASITRARGAALEAAWGAAVRLADADLAHWSGVARDIEQWRRPWRPFVVAASCIVLVAAVFA